MFILNALSVLFVLLILGLSGYRFLIHYRIRQVEQSEQLSENARRKLYLIKQKEQEKHVHILLINGLLIGLTVLCVTLSLFQTEGKVETLRAQSETLKDETFSLKREQKQLITKIPVKEYPEAGIGLADYQWDQLFKDNGNASLQSEMEQGLSQQIVPYFGLSTLVLSIDVPTKTLSLSLVGDVSMSASEKTIQQNMTAFVKEAEAVTQLTQIHFQINETSQADNPMIYSCTYGRNEAEEAFELLDEAEKKAKDDD